MTEREPNRFGDASIVIGIAAFITLAAGPVLGVGLAGTAPLASAIGILALVLGIIGMIRSHVANQRRGQAIAGIILGSLPLLVDLIALVSLGR